MSAVVRADCIYFVLTYNKSFTITIAYQTILISSVPPHLFKEETLCTTESLYQLLIHPEGAPSLIGVNQNTSACWTLHYRGLLPLRLHHLMSQLIERLHCKFSFFLLIVIQWKNNLFKLLVHLPNVQSINYFIRSQVWNCHLVMAKIFGTNTSGEKLYSLPELFL